MRFRLLGPIEAWTGSRRVDLGPPQQRSVLATLLLEAGQVVPVPRLVATLWGGTPPRTAVKNLQVYVHHLRRALARIPDAEVRTVGGGYLVEVERDQVDLFRFRRLVSEARTAPDQRATGLLGEALALWRGAALAGSSGDVLRDIAAQLDEEHLAALENRLEIELRLGHHAECVAELGRLVSAYPLRERLRQLRERILRDDPSLGAPAPAPVPPAGPAAAGLPHDVGGFAGRGGELAELDALLADGAGRIATVDGVGGVGKTALVVHWAHRVRDRFPDGVLYLDLRAHHAPWPSLPPGEALGQLLRGLGTPVQDIPADEDDRARLYRTRLALGRRLVVLDDAASAEQVRPLLAGTAAGLTIVLSRVRLAVPEGAHRIGLRPLPDPEAAALLATVLGAQRLAADPAGGARLARLCGRLPLALRIAAASLAASPDRKLSELGDEMGVRAAVDLSYRALSGPARRLFCLLGTAPGVDFGEPAVEVLGGIGPLAELSAAHLVEEPSTGRYRMHDLVRDHAAERAGPDLPEAARTEAGRRLLDWYLARTRLAGAQLSLRRILIPPGDPQTPDADFDGDPMTWLESERTNLVAAVVDAAEHDPRPAGWRLALELQGFFLLRRHVADWTTAATAGLRIAEQLGDGAARAALHHSLGHAHWSLGAYPDAIDHYQRTCTLGVQAGWREGESGALSALGAIYYEMGRLPEAVDSLTRAMALAEGAGSTHVVATDLVATGLGNLGRCHLDLGELDEARRCLTRALALHREVGSRNGEAEVLTGLAMLDAETGDHDQAAYQAALALRIARDIADRRIECDARTVAGVVAHRRGELAGARERLVDAIEVAESVGYRRGLAPAVTELAAVELDLGDLPTAAATGVRALTLAWRSGYRPAQARALTVSARIRTARGEYDAARRDGRAAVEICVELGLRLALVRAEEVLAGARPGAE
jgi:DNA-binding SARP family transcriptional activator/tetratricopeptide (TPR) repeat protein